MAAAVESGITTFDTAFSYGYDGQCDRLLGKFIAKQRDQFTVIAKVGQRWTSQHQRLIDGSPETLVADAEASLKRIGIEYFDTLMLHSPDPNVPIASSAAAIAALQRRGLCRRIGVCNVTPAQQQQFSQAAWCDAIQCPLNLIQRDSLTSLIPQCAGGQSDVYVFWTLMKGLLAGRISRDHEFSEGDLRPSYEIFQGQARRRTHDVLDAMQSIASSSGLSIAQLSIGWALSQDGVTAALVGARRAEQVKDIARGKPLPKEILEALDAIVASSVSI
jgi:aryl-alcohol dehydrogenase-like predicted oxidoreductase